MMLLSFFISMSSEEVVINRCYKAADSEEITVY